MFYLPWLFFYIWIFPELGEKGEAFVEELLNNVGGFRVERVGGQDFKGDLSIRILGSHVCAMIDVKNYNVAKPTTQVQNTVEDS